MSMLGRLRGKVTGTAKQAPPGDHRAPGTGDRDVGGKQGSTTPVPPVPPVLPLDDDGNDARNIGG